MSGRVFFGYLLLAIIASFIVVVPIGEHPAPLLERAPVSHLQQVKTSGKLRVLTVYGATTYYPTVNGLAGFEYELASRFAAWLEVKAEFIVADSLADLLARMFTSDVDMAAAGLTVTDVRRQYLRFSIPYQQVTEQLIYRGGNYRPRGIDDLGDGFLEVMTSSSHARTLERLHVHHPQLSWQTSAMNVEELLRRLEIGLIDYTIVDSNQFAVLRRFYPRLQVAFDVADPVSLAWAFPRSRDDSLQRAADRFLTRVRRDRTLEQLLDRYYGHVDALGFVDVCTFQRHVRKRLPHYRRFFEEAGRQYGWDWRLLAAIAYQESHWDVQARSPTGVRGLMMLTRQTARQIGIQNRLDPRASIFGAARYLRQLKAKIPARIPEPDRTWFTLAAYNIGFGHVEDARILAQSAGKDPDRWMDVKQYLPLLASKEWCSRVKHGYARGWEPVRYVENVRNYYDLLQYLDARPPIIVAGQKNPSTAPHTAPPVRHRSPRRGG